MTPIPRRRTKRVTCLMRTPTLSSRALETRLALPRQMVRAQGTAPEIGTGRDSYACAIRKVHALDRPFPPMRDSFLPLVADEPRQRRRLRERRPGAKDRQRAHEERALSGHLCNRFRVELKSVFEGVDPRVDPDPGSNKETRMRRDL